MLPAQNKVHEQLKPVANNYINPCSGGNYWKLTAESVAPGYPRPISADWAGLPTNIDAAFTWPESGATYIFKGQRVRIYLMPLIVRFDLSTFAKRCRSVCDQP
jgi:hypothetical protein